MAKKKKGKKGSGSVSFAPKERSEGSAKPVGTYTMSNGRFEMFNYRGKVADVKPVIVFAVDLINSAGEKWKGGQVWSLGSSSADLFRIADNGKSIKPKKKGNKVPAGSNLCEFLDSLVNAGICDYDDIDANLPKCVNGKTVTFEEKMVKGREKLAASAQKALVVVGTDEDDEDEDEGEEEDEDEGEEEDDDEEDEGEDSDEEEDDDDNEEEDDDNEEDDDEEEEKPKKKSKGDKKGKTVPRALIDAIVEVLTEEEDSLTVRKLRNRVGKALKGKKSFKNECLELYDSEDFLDDKKMPFRTITRGSSKGEIVMKDD